MRNYKSKFVKERREISHNGQNWIAAGQYDILN
jgi:hypothetical protein